MKKKLVGDLSMLAEKKPPDYIDKPGVLEVRHGSPKRGFATARFEANLGGFRVHLTVVGPKTEKSKNRLTFTISEAKSITKAATNLVDTLKQNAF